MGTLRKKLEHFLTLDMENSSRFTSFLIYQVRLYIQIARQLVKDNCLQQAASLAFSTLLSMVPIVALLFSMFNSFANLQKYESYLQNFLQKHLLADSASEAFVKIKEFSQNISGVNDVISVVFLLIFSLSLFNTIEGVINSIWKVKKSRSIFDRFISTYWPLVTLGPVLMAVSIQFSIKLGKVAYLGAFLNTLLNLFPMAFISIALIFTYKIVPNTKVRWKPALIGGIIAGILFELAKRGFNLYVTRINYYNNIYLSLTTLVFFLLWVYIVWIIVLFGTEVTYTIQNMAYLTKKDKEDKLKLNKLSEPSVVNEYLALRLFWKIALTFSNGKKIQTLDSLSKYFNLSEHVIEEVFNRLEEKELIVKTSEPVDGIVPAISLGKISIDSIVKTFHIDFPLSNPSLPSNGADSMDLLISQMEKARLGTINSISLQDVIIKENEKNNIN